MKLSRNSKDVFRQVDETHDEVKVPLFSDSEKGYVVGLTAGMTAFGATFASALTAIFNFAPVGMVLAADAGALAIGGTAVIWAAQKLNYKNLAHKYHFQNESPKVKVLLPGQTHSEKVHTFKIDETRNYKQNGYYVQAGSQNSFGFKPTHEVETTIVQKWNGSFIEQTVTPLSEYSWDNALESTLEVHDITEIPKADISSSTNKSTLAINRVKSRGQAMMDRIHEIEEATEVKETLVKGTTK